MSEEQVSQATAAPAPGIPQSPSWLKILMGYWLAAALLVPAGILVNQFLADRPDDLVAYTGHLVDDVVEQTLRANNVPADRILRSSAQMRQDEGARWMDFTLDVYLPKRISADGLRELLRAALLEHGVKLDLLSSVPEGQSWQLTLGRIEFATVRVRDRARAAQVITDLSAACNRITNDVEDVLFDAGVHEEAFRREPPVVHTDEETRWTLTHLAIVLPEGITPGELRGRIESGMSHRDIRVRTEDMGLDKTSLHVFYGGKECTVVLCSRGLTAPPESPAPAEEPGPEVSTEGPTTDVPPAEEATELEPIDFLDEVASEPEVSPAASAAEAPEADVPVPPGPREKRGRVAIILDDGGNDMAVAEKVLALDPNLTLALLPNTPFLAPIAEAATGKGFELMLHMPMETGSKTVDPGPGKITTDMTKAEVQRLTKEALAQISGVKGVNNHTGSAFTSDKDAMTAFLEVLAEEELYFIDSRTTHTTMAYGVAVEMDVPSASRDVFLDDTADSESSRTRFQELTKLALSRGYAIGIGHFREETVALLAQELPKLAEQGVTLVHVSELLR